MKALTFQAEGDVKVIDVPKPDIQASDEALVRVTLGAVCGSDLHILHGHTPMNPGAVLGHEFVGVVEEVGGEVKRFKAGARGTAMPRRKKMSHIRIVLSDGNTNS